MTENWEQNWAEIVAFVVWLQLLWQVLFVLQPLMPPAEYDRMSLSNLCLLFFYLQISPEGGNIPHPDLNSDWTVKVILEINEMFINFSLLKYLSGTENILRWLMRNNLPWWKGH